LELDVVDLIRTDALFIGIDPGSLSGGLVSISDEGEIIAADVMPDTLRDIWLWFKQQAAFTYSRIFAVLEKVHSMPNQGVASSFTFGTNFGHLQMALTAANIPFELCLPRNWQKGLEIAPKAKAEDKRAFKFRLLANAQQLFPAFELWSQPKTKIKQLAIADALLMAEYCRRKFR